MQYVINLLINGIRQSWEILENFEFLGINMLEFSITIMIISALLPIILTLVGKYEIPTKNKREKVEEKNTSRWI